MTRMFSSSMVRAIRATTCLGSFLLGALLLAQGQQTQTQQSKTQPANTSIAAIESLVHSQQYDQALRRTASALHERPTDSRLWTLQGIILSIQGNNPEALASFDKALHLSPNNPAALRGQVQILYQSQNEDKRAIPLLNRILIADPKDQTAHEMLAMLQRKQGDCPAAIEQFRLSGDLIDTHPSSLEAYGDCLVHTKQLQESVPVFERLSALHPESAYAKYDLAVVLVGTKQYYAALKVLEPMLADSSDPDLLSLASEAYEAVGNTPKAVALLRQAIVLDPANPNYYVGFAALCLAHSSFQVGIDMLDAGLQRIHNDPSLYISRGLLYAQIAEYDKSEADFNTAEKLDSAQSLSAYAIDLAEIQRNHNDKALLQTRAQLKEHPESPYLHYILARMLDSEGTAGDSKTSQEAIEAAQQAVKLKPDYTDARDLLTVMYTRSGQYGLAIEQCRLVLQSDPNDQSAIYHLIVALRRAGEDKDKAEIPQLVKRLSALQQSSLQKETDINRYKLVEQQPAPPK